MPACTTSANLYACTLAIKKKENYRHTIPCSGPAYLCSPAWVRYHRKLEHREPPESPKVLGNVLVCLQPAATKKGPCPLILVPAGPVYRGPPLALRWPSDVSKSFCQDRISANMLEINTSNLSHSPPEEPSQTAAYFLAHLTATIIITGADISSVES